MPEDEPAISYTFSRRPELEDYRNSARIDSLAPTQNRREIPRLARNDGQKNFAASDGRTLPMREMKLFLETGGAGGGGAHFRGVDAEAKVGEVGLAEGHEAGVEIAPDEEQKEGDCCEILIGDGVDDSAGKINSQENFRVGHPASFVAVFFCDEGVFFAFDLEFWRAGEFAFYAEECFEHGFSIADGDADTGGHDEGHIEKGAPPGFGAKFFLRDQIEAGDGAGGS